MKSTSLKTFKTFHICELPGAFINAVKHYINTETNITNWQWTAQSLNIKNMSKEDVRKAFGDEANLVKLHPNNYDYGYDKTGDINNYKNVKYYRDKYPDNNLTTADCGLPLCQEELGHILAYSTYLMVFCTTKNGGNSIIKRYVPINNNQEIYLLYLFYQSYEKTIIYKPKLNYQCQEYYLIGINYKRLNDDTLDSMIEFLKKYEKVGFTDEIPDDFLAQLDTAQHMLLDNMNKFIKKKIYFCDNFTKLDENDWNNINLAIKEKINEWIEKISIKPKKR